MNDFIINYNEKIKIYLSDKENTAVKIAARNLCSDLYKVCGAKAELTEDIQNAKIIITTSNGDNYDLRGSNGATIWEAYSITENKTGYSLNTGVPMTSYIYMGIAEPFTLTPGIDLSYLHIASKYL